MNCAELAWETRGGRPLEAEELSHLAGCEGCRADHALREAMHQTGGNGPSEALSSRILAEAHAALAAEPRARPWRRAWLIGSGAAVFAGSASLGVFHVRPELAGIGLPQLCLTLVLFGAAFVLAGRAAFGPGLVPRGRVAAALLALAAALSLLACPGPAGAGSGDGHWGCFGGIVAVSAVPLLALFALLRLRSRAWLSGACAGLAAGALGETAFFLHCPFVGLKHLVGAHLTAWLVLALAGAALVALFPARVWRPRLP